MKKIVFLIICICILAGCNNEKRELLNFYKVFQETIEVEEDISEISSTFNELETNKASIQEEINDSQKEELNDLSNDLIDNADERLNLLEEEDNIMALSKEKLNEAETFIDNISDSDYQNLSRELITQANKRYDSHQSMMETYRNTIEKEKELFQYYKEDQLESEHIDNIRDELSALYSQTIESDELFSKETARLNQLKDQLLSVIEE